MGFEIYFNIKTGGWTYQENLFVWIQVRGNPMNQNLKPALLCLLLYVLTSETLTAIEAPLNMVLETRPGVHWLQRETRYFQIIHTETLSREAGFLAMVLDDIVETINADLIPQYPKKKWPLVISDLGMTSNGFVTLMPRRTVWYSTPIFDEYISTNDWLLTLARHEGRHLGHFDMVDRSTTHVLWIIMGELGTVSSLAFSYPPWFLEGDAVYIESIYSSEGRGRDPMFFKDMALLSIEKPGMSYARVASTSIGEYHPDWYKFGYEIIRWMRENNTDESIRIYAEKSPEIYFPLIALDAGMKKAVKLKPRKVYKNMIEDLADETRRLKESNTWSDAEVFGKEPKWHTTWSDILADGENLFAVRHTYGNRPELIRMLPDGREKHVMYVPFFGGIDMIPMEHRGKPGYRVIWSGYRSKPPGSTITTIDITVTDIDADGKRLKRFHPKLGTRLTSPVLSPDGKRFAAVEYPRGEYARIVILETVSGNVLDTINLPDWSSTSRASWSPEGDRLVFIVRTAKGRQLTEWVPGTQELSALAPLTGDNIKSPIYTPDIQEVVYSANIGGIESLWAVNRETGETRNIVRRWYTASKPAVSVDGQWLYFAEYSSTLGEKLARVPLSATITAPPVPPAGYVKIDKNSRPPIPNPKKYVEDEKRTELAEEGNSQYPARPFNPVGQGLRLHSWGLQPDLNNGDNVRLGMQMTDILGTTNLQFGGAYNFSESALGGYAEVSLTGFRPRINFNTNYWQRSLTKNPWNTVSGGINFNFPMNLSRNGITTHSLIPRVEAAVEWSDRDDPDAEPRLDYSLLWFNWRMGGAKAFRPELGWTLWTGYSHYPVGTGDMIAANLKLHFPGGFRNTFLTLRAAVERQTANGDILSRIGQPRGYSWTAPEFLFKTTIDYEFPLLYPEVPMGSVLYIQRFRFGLHSDFGWNGNADYLTAGGDLEKLWSTGGTLFVDLAFFNFMSGFSLGFRVDWLWRDEKAVFSVDLETSIPVISFDKRH